MSQSSQNDSARKTETIVIKIGTEALCRDNGEPDYALLKSLVAETAELKKQGHTVVWITSGAVGIGKAIAKQRNIDLEGRARAHMQPVEGESAEEREKRLKVLVKQVAASIGQPHLMHLYDKLFYEGHGITPTQLLTEKAHFSVNRNGNGGYEGDVLDLSNVNPDLVNYLNTTLFFPELIAIGNENDATAIRELKLSDNDELAALIAVLLNADRVIYLSKAPGVCKSGNDIRKETVIPLIDFAEGMDFDASGKTPSGTGGMGNKTMYAEALAKRGIYVHIASSREDKVLTRIMRGENVGTRLVYGLSAARPGKRNEPAPNAPGLAA